MNLEIQKDSLSLSLVIVLLACSSSFADQVKAPEGPIVNKMSAELTAVFSDSNTWSFNAYWRPNIKVPKDFYMADHGPYMRITKEGVAKLKQTGLYERFIPGHINSDLVQYFLPEQRGRLNNIYIKKMIERILQNQWPVHTLFYCRFQGNPPPTERFIDIIGDQWIGDGQPETVYRLEPVFHFLKTGRRWNGSSMYLWDETLAEAFFEDELIPRLKNELPFVQNIQHKWTRSELRRLSDLYCEEFCRPTKRPIAWGMYVGSYHMASMPNVVTVAEKGCDPLNSARSRGMQRQFKGNEYSMVWQGHSPIEKYCYPTNAKFLINRDHWGVPLPLLRYYIWRPYLTGAHYYTNETLPSGCIQDVEGDEQYELSTIGHVVKDMLDFTDRHPQRGIIYSPIGLMLDYSRALSAFGKSYSRKIINDDADDMTACILNALFPEPPQIAGSGPHGSTYFRAAPYGELFDLLKPNKPDSMIESKALENYKILFALGGMTFNEHFSKIIKDYVAQGGVFVINASDITEYIEGDFTGLTLKGKKTVEAGGEIICKEYDFASIEKQYTLNTVHLKSAEVIYENSDGDPVVVVNRYGQGHVITLLPHYGLADQRELIVTPRGHTYSQKMILRFMQHFLQQLSTKAVPVQVKIPDGFERNFGWLLSKKDANWIVTLFNYSCDRETGIAKIYGTGKAVVEYPLKEVPFEILCTEPTADVMEWYNDRDVRWKKAGSKAVVSETMHGGEIRVYEFSPDKIKPVSRKRYLNYAKNAKVTSSSYRDGYEPWRAVDGKIDENSYWWSDVDSTTKRVFEMPQTLTIDLGEAKTIDHIFILWKFFPQDTLATRLHINKYVIDVSLDGKVWDRVFDESENEDNASAEGLERWFASIRARYVRLTVLRSSSFDGARLIELKVMGPKTEYYQPVRNSVDYRNPLFQLVR